MSFYLLSRLRQEAPLVYGELGGMIAGGKMSATIT
jgi:hypothetical protein